MGKTYRKNKKGKKLPESAGAVKRMVKKGLFGKETAFDREGRFHYEVVSKTGEEHSLKFAEWLNSHGIVPERVPVSGEVKTYKQRFVGLNRSVTRTLDTRVFGLELKKKVMKNFLKVGVFHNDWLVKGTKKVILSEDFFEVKSRWESTLFIKEVNHDPRTYNCKCSYCRAGKSAVNRRKAIEADDTIEDVDVHISKFKGVGYDKFFD